MTVEEIVNKAIPLSFPGVKCAAIINNETQKALRRREKLTEEINTLLENKASECVSGNQLGVDAGRY